MFHYMLSLLLFLNLGCIQRSKVNDQFNTAEKCSAQKTYVWIKGQCMLASDPATQQAICENKKDGSIWVNEQCVKGLVSTTTQTACEARKDGSVWKQDPSTKQMACFTLPKTLSPEAACAAKENGSIWKNGECYSQAAQTCLAQGNVWNDAYGCLNMTQETCYKRTDGSIWQNNHCMSLQEQSCNQQGYYYQWYADGPSGSCGFKEFKYYCLDPIPPADIKVTVQAILQTLDVKDCTSASDILSSSGGLSVTSLKITNLYPIAALNELTNLNLQYNSITDFSPIIGLKNLQVLNLSYNKISSLYLIQNLPNLKELYLSGNTLGDLTPITLLPNLTTLYLRETQLTDVIQLVNIQNLIQGGLSQLSYLDLGDNCGLKDVTSLFQLSSLQNLGLNKTGVPQNKIPPVFLQDNFQLDYVPCP